MGFQTKISALMVLKLVNIYVGNAFLFELKKVTTLIFLFLHQKLMHTLKNSTKVKECTLTLDINTTT